MKLPLVYDLTSPGGSRAIAEDPSIMARYPGDPLRAMQLASIEEYVTLHKYLLTGRVLDFGCGKPGTCRKPQPYRHLVSGEYVGVDVGDHIPRGLYDTILSTEVMAYLPNSILSMRLQLWDHLKPGGHILLTYTAAWPECEPSSLWRFAAAGMRFLLEKAGFEQVQDAVLCELRIGNNRLAIGHGVRAVRL